MVQKSEANFFEILTKYLIISKIIKEKSKQESQEFFLHIISQTTKIRIIICSRQKNWEKKSSFTRNENKVLAYRLSIQQHTRTPKKGVGSPDRKKLRLHMFTCFVASGSDVVLLAITVVATWKNFASPYLYRNRRNKETLQKKNWIRRVRTKHFCPQACERVSCTQRKWEQIFLQRLDILEIVFAVFLET